MKALEKYLVVSEGSTAEIGGKPWSYTHDESQYAIAFTPAVIAAIKSDDTAEALSDPYDKIASDYLFGEVIETAGVTMQRAREWAQGGKVISMNGVCFDPKLVLDALDWIDEVLTNGTPVSISIFGDTESANVEDESMPVAAAGLRISAADRIVAICMSYPGIYVSGKVEDVKVRANEMCDFSKLLDDDGEQVFDGVLERLSK